MTKQVIRRFSLVLMLIILSFNLFSNNEVLAQGFDPCKSKSHYLGDNMTLDECSAKANSTRGCSGYSVAKKPGSDKGRCTCRYVDPNCGSSGGSNPNPKPKPNPDPDPYTPPSNPDNTNLKSLEDKLNKIENLINGIKIPSDYSKYNQLENRTQELKDLINTLQNKLNDLKQDTAKTEQEIINIIKPEVKGISEKVDSVEKTVKAIDIAGELEPIKESIKALDDELNKKSDKTDTDEIKNLVNDLLTNVDKVEQDIDNNAKEFKDEINILKSNLSDLANKLDENTDQLSDEIKDLGIDLKANILNLENKLYTEIIELGKQLDIDFNELKDLINKNTDELKDLSNKNKEEILDELDLIQQELEFSKAREALREEDYETAREIAENLPDGKAKDDLLKILEDYINDLINKAKKAVDKAKDNPTKENIENAQEAIDELPDDAKYKYSTEELEDKLAEATKAVEEAEADTTDETVKKAQDLVDELPDSEEKQGLQDRIDELNRKLAEEKELKQLEDEAIKAVEKAQKDPTKENIEEAQRRIDLLPDESLIKAGLQERLDKLTPIEKTDKEKLQDKLDSIVSDAEDKLAEATKAVEEAEADTTDETVKKAQDLVDELPESEEKQGLQDRIDELNKKLAEEKELKQLEDEATKAVEEAEADPTKENIEEAQRRIDLLPDDSEVKAELQERLDSIKDKKVEEAKKAIEEAETDTTEENIEKAEEKVNELVDGEDKDNLQKEIENLKNKKEFEDKLAEATKAVEEAEADTTDETVKKAQDLVDELPESEEKQGLQDRIDELNKKLAEEKELDQLEKEALEAVIKAEFDPTEPKIKEAQRRIDLLPDESTIKAELQERLDNLIKATKESDLNNLLAEATKAVEKAEKFKTAEKVDEAQDKVNLLPEGEDRAELQARLDKVLEEIAEQDKANKAKEDENKSLLNNMADKIKELLNQMGLINSDYFKEANKAVEDAEKDTTDENINKAQEKIDELKNKRKSDLQDRLNKLKVNKINRIAGSDRYETSSEVSKFIYQGEKAKTVVIANGESMIDSLTVAPLAKSLNAPILLVSNNQISKSVKDEIDRLNPEMVVIAGGVNSVSKNVEKSLAKYEIVRVAGANRYETAKEIAKLLPTTNKYYVASGVNMIDAIMGSTLSSKNNTPLLLVDTVNDKLPKDTKEITIIGGEKSIANAVAKEFESKGITVDRISGKNRLETSIEIAKLVNPNAKTFTIASGKRYPDALTATRIVDKNNAPLILVDGVEDINELNSAEELILVGGENSLSKDFENKLK